MINELKRWYYRGEIQFIVHSINADTLSGFYNWCAGNEKIPHLDSFDQYLESLRSPNKLANTKYNANRNN